MCQGWMRRGQSGLQQVGPLRERRNRLQEPDEPEEEQCSDDRVRSEEVAASHCRGACRGLSSALHPPHAENLGARVGAVTNECLGRRAARKGQGDREGAGDEGEEVASPVADERERQAGLGRWERRVGLIRRLSQDERMLGLGVGQRGS